MLRVVRRFVRQKHRGLYVAAGVLLCASRLLLLFMRLKRVRRITRACARVLMAGHKGIERARILHVVETVSRRLGFTCLPTAISAQALLNACGYDSRLCLGADWRNGLFAAHAWLERDEEVLIGGPADFVRNYTAFPNLDEIEI